MNKEDIIKILSQKTEWFDGVQEDLIHEGKFDSIANEIVTLFTMPVVSGSWLDHHYLNEDSKIEGVIIKHHSAPETYGGVGIKTRIGNFAIVKENQIEASKNIGNKVEVQPHKDYYGTVMILQYHNR